jgi:hypothetical protein
LAKRTPGGLTKDDLFENKGRLVSKKASEKAKTNFLTKAAPKPNILSTTKRITNGSEYNTDLVPVSVSLAKGKVKDMAKSYENKIR